MVGIFTRPARRLALSAVLATAIICPAFTLPAAARGPDGIDDVAEGVIDAVVNISTKQKINVSAGQMPNLPPGSPFEEFFEEF
ncbi:MAG: serine protease, partial [Pseudolabrys sp.]